MYRYLILSGLLGLVSCYPKGPDNADDFTLVYTNYNPEYDFSSKQTFALPDSIIKITGDVLEDGDGDGKPKFLSPAYSTVILGELRTNMVANGWTEVDKQASPDVILLVSSMTTTNIYYYYDWAYWGWYYPGYWGWYYPGWYYPAYVTGYRSGSIFVQMIDPEIGATSDNMPVEWSCIINGLAEGSTAELNTRAVTGIRKAFEQSPYLKH